MAFDYTEEQIEEIHRHYRQRLEESREALIREEASLSRAREKVATFTGRSLGWWKNELRRAEGAVARQRENIEKYESLTKQGENMTKYSDKFTDKDPVSERSRVETIKKIARISRSIVRDADAQNVTTEDEVENIVTELLSNNESRAIITWEALERADDILYIRFRRYGEDAYRYRNKLKELFNPRLEMLVDVGADWAPLNCFVCDGQDAYENVKEAVRTGLVENFALRIIGDAHDKYKNED